MEEPLRILMHRLVLSELLHNSLIFSKPAFERIILENCIKAARVELFDVLPQPSQESYERATRTALYEICEEKRDTMPLRSYATTWAPVNNETDDDMKKKMSEHLYALRAIVQPEQRTPEWYTMRNNLITASSASKVLFSEASAFALLVDKVEPGSVKGQSSFLNDNIPLEWGKKYEPLSVMYYERHYDTTVQEYGCLIHQSPQYYFIGASPDGINTKENSPRFGRMLEIKNVFTREINGIPKEEYWVQMQMQMEVCDLGECDFLETKYKEHDSRDSYIAARELMKNDVELRFGVMAVFVSNGGFLYEYGPLGMTLEEQDAWLIEKREKQEKQENKWYRNIYWELEKVSCVLVLRNRVWFSAASPKMTAFWGRVETMRSDPVAWSIAKAERESKRKRKPVVITNAPTTVCYLRTKESKKKLT